jgi:pimeloyl-ACP methyl ester carboxylesterase
LQRSLVGAVLAATVFALSGAAAGADPAPAQTFAYDASAPLGLKVIHQQREGSLTIEDITFPSPKGGLIHGQLILPRNKQHRSGALFVHWLGDPKTTNLTEFHRDALTVAQRGSVALSIDAMWSQKDWYEKIRTPETDYENSIKQVVDLRRALDVLLSQPGIEAHRIAYIGHDFGAMYGSVLAGVDPRVRWFVLMAGNPSFEKWYTYSAKPKDPAAFSAQMASIDPTVFLAQSKAEEFLFQFADKDFYISSDEASKFANSAPLPHGMFVYRAKHSLDVPEAFSDRIAWLDSRLNPSP